MDEVSRPAHAALSFCLCALAAASTAVGQAQLGPPQQAYPDTATQQGAQQPAAPPQLGAPQQQPAAPAVATAPDGFQLNPIEQQQLDVVLNAWQAQSGAINTFKCDFERWEYNMAFGPKDPNIPLNKNKGALSYAKPDKGSFQITEINTFRLDPVPAGQQPHAVPTGKWVNQPDAIGEHWVCDGKSIFEYRTDQKQLVERPIPPQMQGQAIVDGPLPFLFGAEAAKLKERYWMKIKPSKNPDQIWLAALPKFQEQAADFRQVDVMLNRAKLLPDAMQITMPNADRHVYLFNVEKATVNDPFAAIKAFFDAPRTPRGWKRAIENVPVAQGPGTPVQQR